MDARVQKLAQVLINYSLNLQPGEELAVITNSLADELNLAVYQEALLAGGHVFFQYNNPGMAGVFYKFSDEKQLEHISEIERIIRERFPAILHIEAESNTRELTGVDPARISRRRSAGRELFQTMLNRMGRGELKWCYTLYPTAANAQEADMSLMDYQDFVYKAGMLDLPDPVAAWIEEAARQKRLIDYLKGKDRLIFRGKDIDLTLSIQGRSFLGASGKENFPDGEIYTSPVETSAQGWVRFAIPAIYSSREVREIEFWFEDGKVVREKASIGEDFLTQTLNTDPGARFLGELGIGTNYAIPRFSKNILFDEKLGGTIHFAIGHGFDQAGGQNVSAVHWDLLCDMSESEITADGETIYRDGKFTLSK
jgi:aminopeptidase